MKINDFIHRYPVTNFSRQDGICRVRTFSNSNNEVIVLLTDIGSKNTSASVTNVIEQVCESLVNNGMIPKDSIILEHYEPVGILGKHKFDIVTLGNGIRPSWESVNINKVLQLLECDKSEMDNLTFQNSRLENEIEKLRVIIDSHVDLPRMQNYEMINRRIEIEDAMISKSDLSELITNGAKEQELRQLIKKDLSIMAEIYAIPQESYVCFSEFPLNGGFVDYVLFTGMSCMDVFLIEIKGADFNLFNQSGYQGFNSKMDSAMKQIRDRLRDIGSDLSDFQKRVHQIYESVLKGESYANSFIGPDKEVHIDKDKDIYIHCVIIGGRTINDIEESRKRHDLAESFKYPLKVESWDTFLKKLRRR